ncbi:uncharacterized protein CDAR_457381 [Caerostris darwini]|uniref:Uncharacterized protein n=1 Tax=Caerostris darwini TaxID=1538125 RepID=A0AAV4PEK7_9ARAC|nr:uncharacterized protein CDAR_457381 [Caerostris darwini]
MCASINAYALLVLEVMYNGKLDAFYNMEVSIHEDAKWTGCLELEVLNNSRGCKEIYLCTGWDGGKATANKTLERGELYVYAKEGRTGPGSKAAGGAQDLLPAQCWRDSKPAFMGQRDTKPHGLQPADPQSAYTVIRILRHPPSLLVALTGIVKDRLYLEAWAVFLEGPPHNHPSRRS